MPSMRIKPNSRAIALAGRVRRPDESGVPRTFASGVLLGLGAASLMIAGVMPRPRSPAGSIASDWDAVRRDFATAIRKHGSGE